MTKNRIILLHILVWVIYLGYIGIGVLCFSKPGNPKQLPDVQMLCYLALPAVALSVCIWYVSRVVAKIKEHQLRDEKAKAELAFQKSQIGSSFLYDTLNYLHLMAYPVSDRLADAIKKLSQLMHHNILTKDHDSLIDLQQEIAYLEKYISIYRLRFEDNFHVTFKAEGELSGKQLAPLVLIPFVENAFKHGGIDDAQRPVRIHLKVIANRLMFTVSNKIGHGLNNNPDGVGLTNIRRRLKLVYPGRHDVLISKNGQTYKVTLNIEL